MSSDWLCEGKFYLSEARDAAGLDVSQNQPGGAVAHSECPAAEDDPLGSAEGADVLKQGGGVKGILVVSCYLPEPSWGDRWQCISPQ